jgi:DNA adenine methylase
VSAQVLRAPFPWFGGKRRAASLVWSALGNVDHYVEPFCGSAAVLLARPHVGRCETVNDLDGMVSNFWRAVKSAPDAVAEACDWPVIEADLHARHLWLVGQRESLTERLIADVEYFDAKVAGWWCWGAGAWIGRGWCDGRERPWRQLPFFGNAGMGVHSATGAAWRPLSARLRDVDVACGGWTRVVSPTVLGRVSGICGVYLDPPYAEGAQQYAAGGTGTGLSADVRGWCEAHGDDKRLRVVLSGYEGEHDALEARGWRVVEWKANGGYGSASGNENAHRERLWLSPACLDATKQRGLFDARSHGGTR